ncbi:MAG: hypothetical protein IID32_12940, partial [Planctomycetes bacterium]|nr:hypothetical protein [Planctomycetota bacterium]
MKFKAILFTLLLAAFATSSAFAAIRYVDVVGGNDDSGANDCLDSGMKCKTIAHALSEADPGDTIIVDPGVYPEGEIDISKNFITLEGPKTGADPSGRTSYILGSTTCHGAEACIVAPSGKDYIFGIGADNVTIDGFDLVGDPATTWAGVKILPGGYDRWTIEYNFIEQVGGENPGSAFNFSYGIYGDSQTSSGSVTMTGNEINKNWLIELGGTSLSGSNETAGMGIFLEGIEGDGTACLTPADKFDCGVWIHDNTIEDLSVGQNSANFSFDVNGKEPASGITIVQDPQNSSPNNGAYIKDNDFDEDDVFAITTENMDFGIVIGIGDSIVDQDNVKFTSGKINVFVVNIDRKASIDEPALADFYKSLNPNLLGPGSDAYFPSEPSAVANSADDATIVFLGVSGSLFRVRVIPQGSSASYKVSLDGDGYVNVRQGARLLVKGEL